MRFLARHRSAIVVPPTALTRAIPDGVRQRGLADDVRVVDRLGRPVLERAAEAVRSQAGAHALQQFQHRQVRQWRARLASGKDVERSASGRVVIAIAEAAVLLRRFERKCDTRNRRTLGARDRAGVAEFVRCVAELATLIRGSRR